MKDNIVEWLRANIKAVDPLQPIRDWMEANPEEASSAEEAKLYGKN